MHKIRFGQWLVEYHINAGGHPVRYQVGAPELKGIRRLKARIAIGAGVQPYRETKVIASVVKDWYTNPNPFKINDDAAKDIEAVARRIFKI